MKIFVAIPVFDGKLPVEVVRNILNEQVIATMGGDELHYCFLPNCSHAAMGRNQLAQNFIDSDCDRLVFLDADVTFSPGSLIKISYYPVDFVGGAYRYKFEEENYPVGWLENDELWSNELGLIEVKALPGGFLSLSRNVFDKLKKAHMDRSYSHFGNDMHCYFQMLFTDGHLYGEDSYFCKEWIDLGEKVYLDPDLTLTHWDFNRPYVGHIGNWLMNRGEKPNE